MQIRKFFCHSDQCTHEWRNLSRLKRDPSITPMSTSAEFMPSILGLGMTKLSTTKIPYPKDRGFDIETVYIAKL